MSFQGKSIRARAGMTRTPATSRRLARMDRPCTLPFLAQPATSSESAPGEHGSTSSFRFVVDLFEEEVYGGLQSRQRRLSLLRRIGFD